MSNLPVNDPERINAPDRRLDGELILDVLVRDEGPRQPFILGDFQVEEVARVNTDEHAKRPFKCATQTHELDSDNGRSTLVQLLLLSPETEARRAQ